MTDRGLQLERTDLAWTRTAAAMVLAGAIHLRPAAEAGGGPAFVPGLTFAAIGIVFVAWSTRRTTASDAARALPRFPIAMLTLAVVSFGVVSMAMIVVAWT